MKKGVLITVVVGIVVLLPVAWYLISPAFIVVEADEALPVRDNFDSMDTATRQAFEQETAAMKDTVMEMDDAMSPGINVLSEGAFKPRAHEVEGKALIVSVDGKRILRFEDFETINGPQLHIYLSTDLSDGDFIDLGKIKATKGNVNYELDDSIDIEKYNKVLVWCKPFSVLFSYAMV